MGRRAHLDPFLAGRVKAKGFVDNENVVVDGLWYANDSARVLPLGALPLQSRGPGVSPVPSDHKDHVDAPLLDGVADLVHVSTAPGGSEERSTLSLNAVHLPQGQLDGLVLVGIESPETVTNAENVALLMGPRQEEGRPRKQARCGGCLGQYRPEAGWVGERGQGGRELTLTPYWSRV